MRKAIYILIISLFISNLLGAQQKAIDPTLEVGSLPGGFSVNSNGAATYSIPITLPDGRAGLTPTLSLNYNSQGGNSLLGARWTIGGFSTISRTGTNLYNEDFIDGVDFEGDDKFILDGQRLIPIDGTLTEYRTVYETFSKVVAHGTDMNNPDWFEVFTKDGRIIEYGNSANTYHSKLIPTNIAATLVWQVNRIKDRQGNYVDYYYAAGNEAGKIINIKYTGSLSNNKAPFYDIDFEYDIREDIGKQYIAGGYIETKSLLNTVTIKYNSATIQTYTIKYNYEELIPRIESITTSDNNGNELNPTIFEYGTLSDAYNIFITNVNDKGQEVDYTQGDFNGDGNTDIVCAYYTIVAGVRNNESWSVFYSTGDGNTFIESESYDLDADFLYFIPGDYNGDGIDDLVKVYPSIFKFYIKDEDNFVLKASKQYMGSITHVSSGTSLQGLFGGVSMSSKSSIINNGLKNIDINGNGKDEILLINYDLGGGYAIMKSFELDGFNLIDVFYREYNNGGTNFEAGYVFPYSSPDLNPVAAGDYTGDGKTNLVLNTEPYKSIILELDVKTNDPFPVLVEINTNGYDYPTQYTNVRYVGDFNGDGIADLFTSVSNIWAVRYFDGKNGWITGSSIPEPIEEQFQDFTDFKYAFSDFNGDGKTDVLTIYQEYYQTPQMNDPEFIAPHWDIYYSNGLGFEMEAMELPFNFPKTCYMAGVQFLDINGDGKSECLMENTSSGNAQIMFFHKDEQTYNIQKIANGLGAETILTYESISNSGSYTKGTYASYPLMDLQYPLLVVTKSEQDNGMGGYFEKVYEYESLIAHQLGIGSLGFQKLICTDKQANMQTITEYGLIKDNDLHYYTFPETITQHPLDWNGEVNLTNKISETNNTVSLKNTLSGNNFVFYPVVTKATEKIWDNESDNTFIRLITTTQPIAKIDDWGNSLNSTIIVSEDESGTMYTSAVFVSTFLNDVENWMLGRPEYTSVISNYVNDPQENIIETDYVYYDLSEQSWPLIKSKIVTPNNDLLHANETLFEYNLYGNITKTTISAHDLSIEDNPPIISRVTSYQYKDEDNYNGRFLTKVTQSNDGVPFSNSYEYNIDEGTVSSTIDGIGSITEYSYSNFGRLHYTAFADNTIQVFDQYWVAGSMFASMAPANSIYFEMVGNRDMSSQIIFKDKHGRELRTIISGMEEDWRGIDKIYNSRGLLNKVSEPYFTPNFPNIDDDDQWTMTMRNSLNNKIGSIMSPTNTISITYNGLQTTTTNNGTGISTTVVLDPLGRKLSVTDPSGNIDYSYYSSGNLKSTNALGNITEVYYDAAGRKRFTEEPNFHETSYLYSNFGELLEQTDHNGNTYRMVYDQLGRLSTKTLENTNEITTYNYYDTPTEKGFGLIESIIGANGISYNYDYDHLNRLTTQTEIIGGTSYSSQYVYNSTGKLDSFVYPSGYSVRYKYTSRGSLYKVLDGVVEDKILWQADAINRRGQLTNFSLGNGLSTEKVYNDLSGLLESIVTGQVQNLEYKFDPITGNLNWRKDHRYNLTEIFTYDELLQSRLETWKVNNNQTYGIIYNPNGNIFKKTDVTNDSDPLSIYQYGQNAGPNAVTTILNPTEEYNQVATPQDIEYTAFNKVSEIQQTKIVNEEEYSLFYKLSYGPDNARKVSYLLKDESMAKIKHFVGSNYEIEMGASGQQRKLHYISGSDGLFAIYVQNGETDTMYYIQKDHLGSYYCVTDEDGEIMLLHDREEQVFSFDPWGRRRQPFSWEYYEFETTYLFDRGYTSHEHLDDFGLINMNGRVYDPWLGRMLSPDPLLQAPTYSQNYNRYSYAFNNPLKYTDPSGYSVYLETMKGRYNYDGGGFNYRGSYYGYNSATDSYTSNSGKILSGPSGYKYNWASGQYTDSKGNVVSYREVHHQYILPNSTSVARYDYVLYVSLLKARYGTRKKFLPLNFSGSKSNNNLIASLYDPPSIYKTSWEAWNLKFIGQFFPDLISVDVTLSSTAYLGAGLTYSVNVLTRGKPGISLSVTDQNRKGAEIDWGVNGNIAYYQDNTLNLSAANISGPIKSLSGGWGLSGQGFLGYDKAGSVAWKGFGVGLGFSYGMSYGEGNTRVLWYWEW